MKRGALQITHTTKGRLPSLPFVEVKNSILGKLYELSIVCISKKKAETLNKTYRNKDYIPNILSFALSNKTGEIFLHLPTIKKQYKSFKMSYNDYILYLIIHGCLHLSGLKHSKEMDRKETIYKKRFKIKEV